MPRVPTLSPEEVPHFCQRALIPIFRAVSAVVFLSVRDINNSLKKALAPTFCFCVPLSPATETFQVLGEKKCTHGRMTVQASGRPLNKGAQSRGCGHSSSLVGFTELIVCTIGTGGWLLSTECYTMVGMSKLEQASSPQSNGGDSEEGEEKQGAK